MKDKRRLRKNLKIKRKEAKINRENKKFKNRGAMGFYKRRQKNTNRKINRR